MNWKILLLSGIVPVIVGFICYRSNVFGKVWMNTASHTSERLKGVRLPVLFVLAYLFGLLISLALMPMVIHQMHLSSFLMDTPGFGEPGSEVQNLFESIMKKYGTNFRSFKHGALHGVIAAIFFAMPVVGMSALFERRGFKYVAIHTGFWIVCLGLMGGILCAYL